MADSSPSPGTMTPVLPAPIPGDCLGRTCLEWTADGELTSQDLSLVLERLALVDGEIAVRQR